MLNNKKIFLTGGTGTFGTEFIKYILKNYKIKRLVIFSRDEWKQSELKNIYDEKNFKNLRFFLGDIRDYHRVQKAMTGSEIVIHAAALKQVPAAEYDPYEFVKTNIIGTQNLIDVALENNIEKFVSLSTDKAASPSNLYGATKLCSDKLVSSANNNKGKKRTKFSIVRYGNVFGSRGSVVPLFVKLAKEKKKITLTSTEMTRYNTSVSNGIEMVLYAIKNMWGGEVFVQKTKSYRICDLAYLFQKNKNFKIIGIRPGEKLHEEMISISDSYNTFDIGKYFVICNPSVKNLIKKYSRHKKISEGKSYNSLNNEFLTINELKKNLKNYLIANKLDIQV